MPRERLSMRKIREILRLRSQKLSGRQIARSLQLGAGTVNDYIGRLRAAGLTWPLADDMDDAALERADLPRRKPPRVEFLELFEDRL